jgi:hypothetical protein
MTTIPWTTLTPVGKWAFAALFIGSRRLTAGSGPTLEGGSRRR